MILASFFFLFCYCLFLKRTSFMLFVEPSGLQWCQLVYIAGNNSIFFGIKSICPFTYSMHLSHLEICIRNCMHLAAVKTQTLNSPKFKSVQCRRSSVIAIVVANHAVLRLPYGSCQCLAALAALIWREVDVCFQDENQETTLLCCFSKREYACPEGRQPPSICMCFGLSTDG